MIVSNQSFSHVRVFRIGISYHIVSHVWRNHLSVRLRQYTKLRLIKVGLYLADDPHIGNYWVPVWWRSLDFFFSLGLIQIWQEGGQDQKFWIRVAATHLTYKGQVVWFWNDVSNCSVTYQIQRNANLSLEDGILTKISMIFGIEQHMIPKYLLYFAIRCCLGGYFPQNNLIVIHSSLAHGCIDLSFHLERPAIFNVSHISA